GILHETYILDVHRYTQPTIQVPEEKANRALQDFLNLEDRSTDDAVGYIRKYGEFDSLELTGEGFMCPNVPTEVQKFCKKCDQEWQDPFALALDDFWGVRNDIVGLWK